MIFFTLLNLAAYPAILTISAVFFTRYFRLKLINPLTVVLGASLPTTLVTSLVGPAVILDGGLFNPYFQYALLVANVHELLRTLTLIVLVRYITEKKVFARLVERASRLGGPAKPSSMRTASLLFLGLYVIFFVLLAQHSFGVIEWIKDPRTGYQLHRTGAGQWYALAITSLSTSLVLATVYARSSWTVLVVTPVYLALIYLLGSKGLVIFFGTYIVVILSIQEYKYLHLVTTVVAGAAALLVVFNFIAAFGSADLNNLASYTDGFTNASHYYQRYLDGSLPLYNGQVFFSNFWGLVPRTLYPDKPYVYGSVMVGEVFYPGAAALTNTPAFATIEYFADFGWIGVILFAVVNPATVITTFLYAILLPHLRTLNVFAGGHHSRVITYATLLLLAPSFLAFFDFPNNLILLAVILGSIDVVNRLRFSAPTEVAVEKAE